MNHNRYFHNICSILNILNYVTFRSQIWPQFDLSFPSKPEVEYFKKSYLMQTFVFEERDRARAPTALLGLTSPARFTALLDRYSVFYL